MCPLVSGCVLFLRHKTCFRFINFIYIAGVFLLHAAILPPMSSFSRTKIPCVIIMMVCFFLQSWHGRVFQVDMDIILSVGKVFQGKKVQNFLSKNQLFHYTVKKKKCSLSYIIANNLLYYIWKQTGSWQNVFCLHMWNFPFCDEL